MFQHSYTSFANVNMSNQNASLFVVLLALLIRWIVSLHPYSGQFTPPMFGDYEAQRHWMEITLHLPVSEWYKNGPSNDLMYWGLDYPPLTAYHSWLCGYAANRIDPSWATLNESRGFESFEHKLFMRFTVSFADLLIFYPAVLCYFSLSEKKYKKSMGWTLVTLFYPGIILIDHGHFQYNCISLGLFLFAVVMIEMNRDLVASSLFCLALNYKQMELYHAMPFFFYFLGGCIKKSYWEGFKKLVSLGITVMATFIICWMPFLTDKDSILNVTHRIFPFARGLFEDKVSNFWCSISVFIKLKTLLDIQQTVKLCLATTLFLLLPSSLHLLRNPTKLNFKFALINSSLIFFLFSYQVHEKSIIIAAISSCLVLHKHPKICAWFLYMSTFSMFPLLHKDGLVTVYIAVQAIFFIALYSVNQIENKETAIDRWVDKNMLAHNLYMMSILGSIALALLHIIVKPPDRWPDLFPLLISMYSCMHFLLALLYFHYLQFTEGGNVFGLLGKKKL